MSQRSGSSLPLFDAEALASTEWESEEPFEDPDGLCTLPESFTSLEGLHWARFVGRGTSFAMLLKTTISDYTAVFPIFSLLHLCQVAGLAASLPRTRPRTLFLPILSSLHALFSRALICRLSLCRPSELNLTVLPR
jgi:hypothetical protein